MIRGGILMIASIRHVVFFVAALLCIGALTWSGELKYAEDKYPTKPRMETGNVIPFNFGGGIVYATQAEVNLETILHTIEMISGAVAALSLLSFRIFPLKSAQTRNADNH
jgi:hypothetical protein